MSARGIRDIFFRHAGGPLSEGQIEAMVRSANDRGRINANERLALLNATEYYDPRWRPRTPVLARYQRLGNTAFDGIETIDRFERLPVRERRVLAEHLWVFGRRSTPVTSFESVLLTDSLRYEPTRSPTSSLTALGMTPEAANTVDRLLADARARAGDAYSRRARLEITELKKDGNVWGQVIGATFLKRNDSRRSFGYVVFVGTSGRPLATLSEGAGPTSEPL